jgi:hypothetical protein
MFKLSFSIAAMIAAVLAFSSPCAASVLVEDFYFTGACQDCTGNGTGTLILEYYTQGNDISNDNFVSFSYSSNLLTLSFSGIGTGASQLTSITGDLTGLPGPALVSMETGSGAVFYSDPSGYWCAGTSACGGDHGLTSQWSTTSATPLPAALPLFAGGLGALGLLGWRRKRKNAATVAA